MVIGLDHLAALIIRAADDVARTVELKDLTMGRRQIYLQMRMQVSRETRQGRHCCNPHILLRKINVGKKTFVRKVEICLFES